MSCPVFLELYYSSGIALRQWFWNMSAHQNHMEGFLKQVIETQPQSFFLMRWAWELGSRICISNKFPGDGDAVSPRTTFWEALLEEILREKWYLTTKSVGISKVHGIVRVRNSYTLRIFAGIAAREHFLTCAICSEDRSFDERKDRTWKETLCFRSWNPAHQRVAQNGVAEEFRGGEETGRKGELRSW